jgi:antitoxin ParD1/3/4
MPIETVSVDLNPEIADQIRQAIQSGEYGSSSEVVEDALREWAFLRDRSVSDLEGLGRAWDEARAKDGPGKSFEEVFDRLERKYQALAESKAHTR